jgi:hypothetical protein
VSETAGFRSHCGHFQRLGCWHIPIRETAMHSCLEVQLQSGERGAPELREEITLLERRIRLMGEDGDCAYERAMTTLYQRMAAERRRQIALFESRSA